MVAKPGHLQASFTSGELDPFEYDRTELKFYSTGLKWAENIQLHPQGGFSLRDGTRHCLMLKPTSARLIPFKTSEGVVHDFAFRDGALDVIKDGALLTSIAHPFTTEQLSAFEWSHRMNTLFLFHEDVETPRVYYDKATQSWGCDSLPYESLPNYDYGGAYTNGVPAEWEVQFVELDGGYRFRLTVSGSETISVKLSSDSNWSQCAADMQAAILQLPNVAAGVTCEVIEDKRIKVIFGGDENSGDAWAVSADVLDDSDAAIPCYKLVVGIAPGETIISNDQGWPSCGLFYQQRTIVGGFKNLPNNWMCSITGRYFSFDTDLDEANGAFVVPLDSEGGEKILHMVDGRNMLVFTSEREFWISDRSISKTEPTVHVEASTHGSKAGVPVVKNEGGAIFCHKTGSVLSEFRYTDVDGNFISQPISILSPHLFEDVCDMAVRKANASTDANLLGVIDVQGRMRAGFLLRQQDVTGFGRFTSAEGIYKAIDVNSANTMNVIMERKGARRLEAFEKGLILDASIRFSYGAPKNVISGLDHLEGMDVWCLGDGNVYGPYTVANATITLDDPVKSGEVGLFCPPVIETLPPSREIADKTILRRKSRIHSVWVSVIDTTSIAIGANGQEPVDFPLRQYDANLVKPELEDGYTGLIELRGLRGYQDEPTVKITQLRPGRLTVRSITSEAKL
nr:hypothetical protein [uncultured Cohaesibacter sp.]